MNNCKKKIFFSGIAGSGLSALALFMAYKGQEVSGSDRQFDAGQGTGMLKTLQNAGVEIFRQDGSGIRDDLDLTVISTAVEKDRPDILRTRELGVKLISRPEFLASISAEHDSIAIAGTSGKSTVSGMLGHTMHALGMEPGLISGGRVKNLRTDSNPGNVLHGGSAILVMEADESDGSIVNYRPMHSVVHNLALDHHSVRETASMFSTLMRNTQGTVALNADDSRVMSLAQGTELTYSVRASSDVRATDVALEGTQSTFSVEGQRVNLKIPGLHNVYNALSALSMLKVHGANMAHAAQALSEFRGIERRFDIHSKGDGTLVVDDYAHNPHKIEALMHTISNISKQAAYVFQPHGFGPLGLMLNEYAEVFNRLVREGDALFILPVYYPGGSTSKGIGSEDLQALCPGSYAPARRAGLLDLIGQNPRKFDCITVFGARDESLSELASEIAEIAASW